MLAYRLIIDCGVPTSIQYNHHLDPPGICLARRSACSGNRAILIRVVEVPEWSVLYLGVVLHKHLHNNNIKMQTFEMHNPLHIDKFAKRETGTLGTQFAHTEMRGPLI